LLQHKKKDLPEKNMIQSYPHNAVEFVLKYVNLKLSEVDQIVFFEKPFLKFERLLETYVSFAPKGFFSFIKAMPIVAKG
jgi:carbamoyltransferase